MTPDRHLIKMTAFSLYLDTSPDIIKPILENLAGLFRRMDKAYNAAAVEYGFNCSGCEDNCCRTSFYHHTVIEYFYLHSGYLNRLEKERAQLRQRASRVKQAMARADARGEKRRIMCPLNLDGLCSLYRYRPMICRLHGLPSEIQRPGGGRVRSPGCGDFDRQCGPASYIKFDRTPLYMEMLMTEKEIREKLGFTEKIKMTVAGMVDSFPA